MSRWAVAIYGDPCRECGFSFASDRATCAARALTLADEYTRAFADASGSARTPTLAWPAVAYLWHVIDNYRIWTDRLVGLHAGDAAIVAYDQDELAAARHYEGLSVAAGLAALPLAIAAFTDALAIVAADGAVLDHPEAGPLTPADIASQVTHDAVHHLLDVGRCTGPDGFPSP